MKRRLFKYALPLNILNKPYPTSILRSLSCFSLSLPLNVFLVNALGEVVLVVPSSLIARDGDGLLADEWVAFCGFGEL